MSVTDKFEKLQAFYKQLMPTITPESWLITQSYLNVRVIKKRNFLIREGTVCNHVSFINSGLLRMYYLKNDKEKILGFCTDNCYISEYKSFLTRKPAQLFIQAIEDTEVIETNYDDLQKLYKEVPEANFLGRMISEQLFIEMSDQSISEINETIEQRYNKLIEEQPWLLQRVPQYMIASYLGITPEALSRVKNRISRKSKKLVPVY